MNRSALASANRCPVCRQGTSERLSLPSFVFLRCDSCGHGFGARRDDARSEQPAFYANASYHGFDEDARFRQVLRQELSTTFRDMCPPPAALLDIGCGNGTFVEEARRAGYDALGTDTSAAAIELCRSQGIPARLAGEEPTGKSVWDIVTAWDVMEHLEDPVSALSGVNALLRDDGILIIKVPTFGSPMERVFRVYPLAAERAVQVPYHVTFFSDSSIRLALDQAGFEVLQFQLRGPMRGAGPPVSLRKSPKRRIGRAVRTAAGKILAVRNFYLVARKVGSPKDRPPVGA